MTVASVRAREQITEIVGGQIVAATDAPLLTSATTPWSGFLLEKHDAAGRQDVRWGWHRTHVALFTKGTLAFQINEPANRQDFVARAGSVCIFPSGFDETNFSLTGSKFEAIVVELDPARLEGLAGSNPQSGALTPQIVVEDTQIAALLRNMASEVAEGCPYWAPLWQIVILGTCHLSIGSVFSEGARGQTTTKVLRAPSPACDGLHPCQYRSGAERVRSCQANPTQP